MVSLRRIAPLFAFALFLLGAASVPDSGVTTLAGDGVAGTADGASAQARFLSPFDIAYDPNRNVAYVTDSSGQTVRLIDSSGNVSTFAGASHMLPSGLGAEPGYRDGDRLSARFDRPTGIGVASDGAVYVADSFNQCIRKIAGDVVSTFAGSRERQGHADGPVTVASFNEPRGLAVAADGTVFVADYGVGIREITGSVVKTIVPEPHVLAVAVAGTPDDPYVYYTFGPFQDRDHPANEGRGVVRMRLKDGSTQAVTSSASVRQPADLEGILVLDRDDVIATSPGTNVVFLASFACSAPNGTCIRVVSGGFENDEAQTGSFADGALDDTGYYLPVGISRGPDGSILIADLGNRRIRQLRLDPDPDLAGPRAGKHVLVITGPSLDAFEEPRAGLGALVTSALPGTTVPADVRHVTIRPGDPRASVDAVVRAERPDLVIFCLDRQLFGSGVGSPDLAGVRLAQFSETARLLERSHVASRSLFFPLGEELGESMDLRDSVADAASVQESVFALDVKLAKALANREPAGERSLLADFVRAESTGTRPLFYPDGMLLSVDGRRLIAGEIARDIASALSQELLGRASR